MNKGHLVMILVGLSAASLVNAQPQLSAEARLLQSLIKEIDELKASVVPGGAVVPFDADTCPPGWQEYVPASGRFIAGVGRGRDKNGYEIQLNRGTPPADVEGEYVHTLTVAEIPSHTHRVFRTQGKAGNGAFPDWSVMGNELKQDVADTGPTGGGKAHNSMPPYVALKMCKKS
jgi:hypothetical protein